MYVYYAGFTGKNSVDKWNTKFLNFLYKLNFSMFYMGGLWNLDKLFIEFHFIENDSQNIQYQYYLLEYYGFIDYSLHIKTIIRKRYKDF